MNHDQLIARLERERISYPDQLEAERYAPDPLPVMHKEVPRPYQPITQQQAADNYAVLKQIADREGDHE